MSLHKALRGLTGKYVNAGVRFQWDTRTQALTLDFDFWQLRVATSQSDLPVPFTFANAFPAAPTPFEVYFGTDGYLHFRAISHFNNGIYLEWKVAVNVCDGLPRRCVIRHNGGGNVAAYSCYFDGAQQTIVSVVDNLTGSTVPPGDFLCLLNQQGFLATLYGDGLGPIRVRGVDMGHAWAVALGTSADPPSDPSDALMAYNWTETGLTETDLATGGIDATLSHISLRDSYVFPSRSPSSSPSASPSHSPSTSPSSSRSSSPSASVSASPSTSPSDAVTTISISVRVTTQR